MSGEEIHVNDLPQWPTVDSSQPVESHKELYLARPFLESYSDLDLDFGEDFRPVLITQLLSSCLYRDEGSYFSEQDLWRWSLKERFQGLLAIVISTLGQKQRLRVRCSKTPCRELMEIDLDLAFFIQEEQPVTFTCRPDSETELQLRLPSGLDQLNWVHNQDAVEDTWFCEMASTLVSRVNGEEPGQDFRVPEKWLDQIGSELDQHDDLMTLEINTSCPACGEDLLVDIDLEEKLLEILSREQQLLLKQIHRLASLYHWSEADIVAMPKRRRKYYLAQIDEEAAS